MGGCTVSVPGAKIVGMMCLPGMVKFIGSGELVAVVLRSIHSGRHRGSIAPGTFRARSEITKPLSLRRLSPRQDSRSY